MIRLYVDQPLQENSNCSLDVEGARYLRQVMRRQPGDRLVLFNGQGGEFEAEILALHRQGGECALHRFLDVSRELPFSVHIIQTANRSEKIEQVLQKGTELGAAAFCITVSEHAQLRLPQGKLEQRLGRWRKIIIEAAEQSGRTRIPALEWLPHLRQLPEAQIPAWACYLHPTAENSLADWREALSQSTDIRLAIGPEGGWSEKDGLILAGKGFHPLRFGERIMRTETAAPALLAALQALRC